MSESFKDCYCITCDRGFHHLGIMSHRAAHRRRNEYCEIEFSTGKCVVYNFDSLTKPDE